MTKTVRLFIITLLCTFFAFVAQAEPAAKASNNLPIIPQAPNLSAKAYILTDAQSGMTIVAKNADKQVAPASLTKLMTLYITFEQLEKGTIRLTDTVRVSKKAWKTGGSRMFLRVGTTPTVKQLIQGVIVDSGNDACIALAEHIAGSEDAFVQMMNEEAQKLGMTNTHFMNATGLPHAQHYSTAKDLSLLARAIILDFPQDYHFFSEKWFTYNNIKQPNRNRLLWHYQYADGLKTGHTSEAGFCLIASAQKDGARLISVVLGTPSDEARADESQSLLTYGFRFYKTYEIFKPGLTVATPRVYLGKDKTTPVGVKSPLYITIPDGFLKTVKTTKTMDAPLKAPLAAGQTVGTVTVTINNKPIKTAPLVTLKANPTGGFFGRMSDHVALGFHKFFGK